MKAKNIISEDLLTMDQAADFLKIKKSYLYKLTSDKLIKHYKPGGKKIYFLREDLSNYITAEGGKR